MIPMAAHLIDNVAVDWAKAAVVSYVCTMKQLVRNTFVELYPQSWSSAPAMTSHDMVVLVTAFISIFGLGVSLSAVYSVYRIVRWICVDEPTNGLSE